VGGGKRATRMGKIEARCTLRKLTFYKIRHK